MREPGRGMWRAGIRFFSYPYSIDFPAGIRIREMKSMHEGPMDWTIEELADAQRAPLDLLLDADPSEEMVRGYLRDGTCLVARRNGQIAGILIYIRTRPLTAEIMIVSVREDCRNRGIARSLILRAIERARSEPGIPALFKCSSTRNAASGSSASIPIISGETTRRGSSKTGLSAGT